MKKLLVLIAVMLIASSAAFAELGLGGAAFLKSPVLAGQPVDLGNLNVNQFSFGADARYKLGWFQAEGLLLYSAGEVNSLNAFLDAGVALDFAIFRFSVRVGPNFSNNFGKSYPIQAGINAKIGADVKIGMLSVGLSYIMAMNIDNGLYVNTASGLIGLQVSYWL